MKQNWSKYNEEHLQSDEERSFWQKKTEKLLKSEKLKID
jgi:hypothetical protein